MPSEARQEKVYETIMHSSRMRTTRSLTVYPGSLPSLEGGIEVPGLMGEGEGMVPGLMRG